MHAARRNVTAAGGEISGSVLATDAVPRAWDAAPIATPRDKGSPIPIQSRNRMPKLAPTMPWMMTPIPASPMLPPSDSTIGTAIGRVMKRGTIARPTSAGRRAMNANAAVKSTDTTPVDPAPARMGKKFFCKRRRCLYRLNPSATMAGDAKAKIMSPTPVPPRTPPVAVRKLASAVFQSREKNKVPRRATNAEVIAEHVTIAGQNARTLGSRVLPNCSAEIVTERIRAFAISFSTPTPAEQRRAAARRTEDATADTSAPFSTIDVLGLSFCQGMTGTPASGGSSVAAAFAASAA
mmetsp:Transcript_37449/g.88679  ORF Transcript_37449/g.88679 Transcript_37449/m.88679 type:complete len:294 (+) Transcript_37449:336-1217(+)